MDDRLIRIEDKLDKLVDIQGEILVDLAVHMKRTQIAELNIERIANEIKPIQEHVAFLKYSGKLIGMLAALSAVAIAIIQLIKGV